MQAFLTAVDQEQAAKLVLSQNAMRFIPGDDTLVVTFLSFIAPKKPDDRSDDLVWGEAFLVKRGYSVLGVNRQVSNWYRAPDLHEALNALKDRGFFARYRRVLFYGGSMGGFAALAFAELSPGCTVLAHNPQTTLRPRETPWETRYQFARGMEWDGEFSDGAVGARFAARVYVSYDPFHEGDRRHVERLDTHNLVLLKVPVVGHQMALWLLKMGVLAEVFDSALDGSLTSARFRELAKARFNMPHYLMELSKRVRHPGLKQYLVEKVRGLVPGLQVARKLLWSLPAVTEPRPTSARGLVLMLTFGDCPSAGVLGQLKAPADARWIERPFTGNNKPHDLTALFESPNAEAMVIDELDRCLASHELIVHSVLGRITPFERALLKASRARGFGMVLLHRPAWAVQNKLRKLPPPVVKMMAAMSAAGDRHLSFALQGSGAEPADALSPTNLAQLQAWMDSAPLIARPPTPLAAAALR